MKDPATAVRVGYKNKLDGQVVLDGVPIKWYGRRVPVNAVLPYGYFPRQNGTNDGSKVSFTTNHEIDVELVFASETGTQQDKLDDMSNQVLQIIARMKVEDCPQFPGFVNVGTTFLRSIELTDYNGTYTYLRKIITFNNIIYEGGFGS